MKHVVPLPLILEHINCDLCGCEEYLVRYRKPDNWLRASMYEFPVVECRRCGLVYVNPRPTSESMGNFYPADYHDRRDDAAHKRRYGIQAEYVPRVNDARILDIGCARGDWLKFLDDTMPGNRLHGCDAFAKSINYGFEFIPRTLPQCGYPDAFFDVITAWAVFEHLHTPMSYFKEVGRILKPGGSFIALVTNSESLYGRRAYTEDIPRHTYHYSEKTLAKYAEQSGLKLDKVTYEERLWDGRGIGTMYFAFLFAAGATWQNIMRGRCSSWQTRAARIGAALDSIIFRQHWEQRLRRSGIVVASFSR